MKISEASDFFKTLIAETNRKSELKVYQTFINILINLNNRNLTEQQLNSIENKLDSLNLSANSEYRKKHLKTKLTEFTNYLKKELSLITEGYYTGIGMIFGMMFGSGIGLTFGSIFGDGTGIAIGMMIGTGLGMVLGMMLGAAKDSEVKKQNRVLK